MLSIGEFAKFANVSPRTLRHYEDLGLIVATSRGENNYRYFDNSQVEIIQRIRDLQRLGFCLEEVKEVLALGNASMSEILKKRLNEVEVELGQISQRRDRLVNLLSISQRVESSQSIGLNERRAFMEAVKEQVINGVQQKVGLVTESHLEFLRREKSLYDSKEKREFLEAVKKCVTFAQQHDLILGAGRGSCPSSIVLYGLGFSGIDPTKYDLLPERLSTIPPDIHIDVEYERGQPFVDYCRQISQGLAWGEINAFKMPLIDIIKNVHQKIGKVINYQDINDDDEIVLGNIRRAEIEKIFLFDFSPEALVMKYENFLPDFAGTQKLKEYLLVQRIDSFRDVVNIIALWRPNHSEMIARIERYREAKTEPNIYRFLTPELRVQLENNYGLVIYHEDVMRIIAAYTDWDMERCSRLRRDMRLGISNQDLEIFRESAPREVFELVTTEIPWTFCKPHAIAHAQFTKQTSVLKSLHKDVYFEEIAKWQARHGLVWDDIGIKIKGVSLLQH